MVSEGRLTKKTEMERLWKEAVIARNLPGFTEEN
jgi:hypothetical protein